MSAKFLLLSGLALAIMGLSSCQRKSFDSALAGTFFPLRPGLTWTYKITDNERATTHILIERVLEGAGRHRSAGANEVESEYSDATAAYDFLTIYLPEHGYFTRQVTINKSAWITAERAFLPQLIKPNLTWSNSLVPFAQQPGSFRIEQTHRTFFDTATIEVPAGHFAGCIRIETVALYRSSFSVSPPLELKYIDWYAPRVGLVKTLVAHTGLFGSEVARIELLSFGYGAPKTLPSLPVIASSASARRDANSLQAR